MKKKLLFTLIGGVIIFIWQFLSFALLNLHQPAMEYTASQDEILKKIEDLGLEEGMYFLGQPDPSLPQEEQEEAMKKYDGKPWATLNYHKEMSMDMVMPTSSSRIPTREQREEDKKKRLGEQTYYSDDAVRGTFFTTDPMEETYRQLTRAERAARRRQLWEDAPSASPPSSLIPRERSSREVYKEEFKKAHPRMSEAEQKKLKSQYPFFMDPFVPGKAPYQDLDVRTVDPEFLAEAIREARAYRNFKSGLKYRVDPARLRKWETDEEDASNKELRSWATLNYHKEMSMDMVMPMIRGIIIDFIIAFFLFWLFLQQKDANLINRLLLSVCVGLIVFLSVPYTNYIWFKEPDIWAYLLDGIVPWAILGFVGHKMAK